MSAAAAPSERRFTRQRVPNPARKREKTAARIARLNACTIIARNYLAHARVLAESFREHHRDGRFSVLVLDDVAGEIRAGAEPFEVVSPYEIGLDRAEFHRMAMIYDVMELATAVKPWLLRTLLETTPDITYFDPDIRVYTPLDDISAAAREHEIVLIPHVLEPMPRDNRVPSETTILEAGIYNLGFIAVSSAAQAFLDWWSERLARDCRLAPAEARFVDQRWIDFVPGMFSHHILRDPAADVAHWNLWSRRLEWTGERYEVDGRPLRFYHFSGFDPERPHLLSKHQGNDPRVLLSDRPGLAQLCREYADELLAAGYRASSAKRYVYDTLPGGIRIDARMRRLYRHALIEAEQHGRSPTPPDPFDPATAEAFVEWLTGPKDERGEAGRVSRYLTALYNERPDLQVAFPDLRWSDADRFLAWIVTDGQRQESIPPELLPGSPQAAAMNEGRAVPQFQPGINIAGYFRAELGIGEAARLVISGIEAARIPYATITYEAGTSSRQEHPFEPSGAHEPLYDINVICVNADRLLPFASDVGPDFFRGRYSIGVWFWEVPRFPAVMHPALDVIDEVWVCSEYIRDAIAAETDKPVHILPLPVRIPSESPASREELGLPDSFLFLFSFDFFSIFERKNPLALVAAFRRAFAPNEGPVLVIKSINGDKVGLRVEELRAATNDREDIILVEKYVTAHERDSYMAQCDCYVSLHRSEGFGLTMAEAMAHAKPVIATGYSGNLMFMNDKNSYLVPYELSRIPPGCDPYPEGAHWAEPDVEQAAELMRHVYENTAEAEERGLRGHAAIKEVCSPERAATFISGRVDEIHELAAAGFRGGTPPSHLFERDETALVRAARVVARGPVGIGTPPSPFGRPVALARRVLDRLLAPYVYSQYELSSATIQALNALQETQGAMSDQLTDLEQDRREMHRLADALGALSTHVRDSERDGHELRRVADVLGEIHLEVRATGDALQRLTDQLVTRPYMANTSLLETIDEDGRPAIGFRDGSGEAPDDLYRGFEEIFRGSEDFIRERQRVYLEVLDSRRPVLDVGCGRGEFLELLREAGTPASGIDLDEGMVAHCRAKGLDVKRADAIEYLESLQAHSLGAIFCAQVVEHLGYEDLIRFFRCARERLEPDGMLIAETVNPHSIQAFKTFWLDPTHKTLLFPEVAVALCRLVGFSSGIVMFPNGLGELERDRVEQGEYAVVARTAA